MKSPQLASKPDLNSEPSEEEAGRFTAATWACLSNFVGK